MANLATNGAPKRLTPPKAHDAMKPTDQAGVRESALMTSTRTKRTAANGITHGHRSRANDTPHGGANALGVKIMDEARRK